MDLSTPITYVKGVGPQRAEALEAKGLATAGDLLFYAPFRYEDRTNVKPLDALAPGEMAAVMATVHSVATPKLRRRNLGIVEVVFTDGVGGRLLGKWFHASAFLTKILEPGVRVALYGKVEFDGYSGELSMLHPRILTPRESSGSGPKASLFGAIRLPSRAWPFLAREDSLMMASPGRNVGITKP